MECEKILFSRLIFSFLWALVLHVFPLSLYILITNFDIVHPLEWVLNSTIFVFSIGTWVSLIPLQGLVFAIGYVSSQELKKPRSLITSRFKLLCSLFTKNNILKWFLHLLLGIILPWTYLKFNDVSLIRQCKNSAQNLCLEEDSLFIVTCGIWTSNYYFIRFTILTDNYLQFPIIRQLQFLQIKSKFLSTFKNCFKLAFIPVCYFLPFYFWYSRQVTSVFEFFLSASLETSNLTSTVSGFFKISLLIKAFLISSIYFSLVEVLQLMIQIHFTEHYSFELVRQPKSNNMLLATALGEHNVPIIQHLGCYDLFILSTSQKSNRWQLFTLSQPGGHPHTWNAILHESLKLIEKFICEIQEIYKVPELAKPKSPVPKHYHIRENPIRYEEITRQHISSSTSRLRSLVDLPQKPPMKQQESAVDEFWTKIESYMNMLEQNSVVSYIFGSKPDAKVRFLVSNSQPLIWVIQSISELAATALMEDQFGIVLKDLPSIINTLLRLKFSLDKLGNIQKKLQKRDHDLCMKASLKSALRRSLYRIAIAYSDYLTDLPLPPENLNCMKNFVNFKEC